MAWDTYYKVHQKSNTSKLLIEAEKYITIKMGEALDIATGTGRDISFLLSKGFLVTAIDKEKTSIDIVTKKFNDDKNLTATEISIEDFDFIPNKYSFINAQFALFFVNQSSILKTLEKVKLSLVSGGIFCGQILGKDDDWANLPKMNSLTELEIRNLYSDFEIIKFEEIKKKGPTVAGSEKFWNYYNLIIKKGA